MLSDYPETKACYRVAGHLTVKGFKKVSFKNVDFIIWFHNAGFLQVCDLD